MWSTQRRSDSALVIVPAHNEELNIVNAVRGLLDAGAPDYVVIDDGSTDATAKVCAQNGFNCVSLPRNAGLAGAIRAGCRYAAARGYAYVVQYDGDGQHDPRDVVRLVNHAVASGTDIVCGTRFLADNSRHGSLLKEIARKIFSRCIRKQTGATITDPTNGLRVFSRRFYDLYAASGKYEAEPSTIAFAVRRHGLSIAELPTTVRERAHGTSMFERPGKVLRYMFRQLRRLAFTTRRWDF